jgi:hypothetical protein
VNTTACGAGGWAPVQIQFLNDNLRAVSMRANLAHSLLSFLFYFPGNKVYGWDYGTFTPGPQSGPGCQLNGGVGTPRHCRSLSSNTPKPQAAIGGNLGPRPDRRPPLCFRHPSPSRHGNEMMR